MSKEQVNTRLPSDVYESFEEYREERDIAKSEAARRLIGDGLDTGDLRDELRETRQECIRLEERVQNLERERDRLEEERDEARREAETWKAKFNESQGKLKVHHSESDNGVIGRLKGLFFD
jgi:chromosome segregation ATPase